MVYQSANNRRNRSILVRCDITVSEYKLKPLGNQLHTWVYLKTIVSIVASVSIYVLVEESLNHLYKELSPSRTYYSGGLLNSSLNIFLLILNNS